MPAAHPNWFIGIRVPPGTWFEPLQASVPLGLRRFHPEDLHTTVAFLGPCGPHRARQAFRRLSGPFVGRVVLGAIRPMGRPSRPSAFSVLLSDDGGLSAWISAVRAPLLVAAGAPPDSRPPLPHVTVCRPPLGASQALLRAACDWAASVSSLELPLQLREVALYTWSDDRGTRIFRAVERLPAARP